MIEQDKEKPIRIVLEVSPGFAMRIDELQELVEAGNRSQVLRDAVRLYESFAEMQRDGYRFKLVDPRGQEEYARFLMHPKPGAGRNSEATGT